MRLTRKFTLWIVLGILVVHAINASFRIRREEQHFHDDVARDERLMGTALANAALRVWNHTGEDAALDVVTGAGTKSPHLVVRWHWLLGQPPASLSKSHLEALEQGLAVAITKEGASAISTFTPVRAPDGRLGAIEIEDDLSDVLVYLKQSITSTVLVTVILVILCGVLAGGLGVVFVGRPMRLLVEQARRIGAGNLTQRLALAQRDEIGILAAEMNGMCEGIVLANETAKEQTRARIAAIEQLRHADRLTTVGSLASGIAHELGTPLNVVKGYAQLIQEDVSAAEPVRQNAALIEAQSGRMAQIIRQLLDFARRSSEERKVHDLADVLERTFRLLAPLARKRNVDPTLQLPGTPALALVDPDEIGQVVTNLVMNAIDAMSEGGPLRVTMDSCEPQNRPQGRKSGHYVRIRVEDHGSGMVAAVRDRVFEPFFTTKKVGEGTGLGLSVAYGIVQEHGGWITVDSQPKVGTTFSVYLPQASP
jgi:two-component system, NtrC family, sensor kinase